ncbi:uncharacterized protein RAG0_09139 [Rhynchosporium agropyri]|uniref:Maleate cis-trans isomerase n=1 Tax=Rhynchosporium agropyri TaxID=914238 RepID=A0A1E1KU35_9HELO|nr:uncharacterized protein RAG0_09139 [Rhynchosporium agropyri]
MSRHLRLDIIVPSSNTALKPLRQAIINSINTQLGHHITVHFSRFAVTTISLTPYALGHFEVPHILATAELLAHAQVDVIGWSGTAAGWTGIKATTSVLALNKLLEIWRVKRLGLVTPYVDDVQAAIVKNYKAIGVEIGEGMERHLSVQKNNDIAAIGEDLLDGLVKEVVIANVDAVATFCTNLNAAQRVQVWEKKHVIPVFDTITTVLWDMLRQCSVDMSELEGWGLTFKKS